MNNVLIFLLVLLGTFIGSFGSLFLKKAASKLRFDLSILRNKDLFLGVSLFLLSSVSYIWALKHGDLSFVYPITSLSYIWVCLLSIKFLNERMNSYKWIGIIFIILGVFLITR